MAYLDSETMLTAVRRGGVSGSHRGLRRAHAAVEEARNLPTQPYGAVTNPTTEVITGATRVVATEGQASTGGSLRFLSIGLALGVILAFLLSGHNLVRLRTALALAILPDSALRQLQQPPATESSAGAIPIYATTTAAPMHPVAEQTSFQPVPRPTPVLNTFPIPLVDVTRLPKHAPTPRQASRPRSGGSKPPSVHAEEAAAPFDARTIEASLAE